MTQKTLGMQVLVGLAAWGLAEIAAFIVVGAWIGVLGVLALVLGSGALGVALLRRQGLQAVGQMRGGVVMLRPGTLGATGLTVLSGALLILPGLLTDLAGLLLLAPAVRRWIALWLGQRFRPAPKDDVLDGLAVEVEAPRLSPRQPSGWTRP